MAKEKNDITMEDVVIKRVRRGQQVTGTVFKVEDDLIYVTLENNAEAMMYRDHYGVKIDTFVGVINEGDTIEAVVSKINESDDHSSILLNRRDIVKNEEYDKVRELYKSEEKISLKVTKVDERGLHLQIFSFTAFLPYGLLDNELVKNKETLKGKMLDCHIIEVKPGRRPRIIVSRKKIFEEQREEQNRIRKEEFDNINTGDVLTGTIHRIERHMALVRFNHISGRLRISQIRHTRIENIKDILHIGDTVTVKVIKKDNRSLDLSMKALLPTPFDTFVESNKKGDTIVGEVVQKLPFGIILELAEQVRGLLHKSEFSWNPDDNFQSYVKIGDKVETVITLIDSKRNKISLSRRLLLDNPWKDVRFTRGEEVEGKVLEVTEQGLVVEAKGVNGFVPLNELGTTKIEEPSKHFAEGDKVKAVVTEVNPKRWYLRLSIKQALIRAEKSEYEKYLVDEDAEATTIGDLFAEVLEGEDE